MNFYEFSILESSILVLTFSPTFYFWSFNFKSQFYCTNVYEVSYLYGKFMCIFPPFCPLCLMCVWLIWTDEFVWDWKLEKEYDSFSMTKKLEHLEVCKRFEIIFDEQKKKTYFSIFLYIKGMILGVVSKALLSRLELL